MVDYSERLMNLKLEDLLKVMSILIDEKLKSILPILERNVERERNYKPLKLAVLELCMTKQTFYAWKKEPKKMELMKDCIQHRGKKVYLDVTGFKLLFKKHDNVFAKGRYYDYYAEATLEERRKNRRRYNELVKKRRENNFVLSKEEQKELDELSNLQEF